jgi:hypothetical protein
VELIQSDPMGVTFCDDDFCPFDRYENWYWRVFRYEKPEFDPYFTIKLSFDTLSIQKMTSFATSAASANLSIQQGDFFYGKCIES